MNKSIREADSTTNVFITDILTKILILFTVYLGAARATTIQSVRLLFRNNELMFNT